MIWIFIAPVLIWAVICLAITIHLIRMLEAKLFRSDDFYMLIGMFFSMLVSPPVWLVKYFILRRELKEIKKYVDGIRNKTGSAETDK